MPKRKRCDAADDTRRRWSPQEDGILAFAHSTYGGRWRAIATAFFVDRNDTSIRNRVRRLRDAAHGSIFPEDEAEGWLERISMDMFLVDLLLLWEGEL